MIHELSDIFSRDYVLVDESPHCFDSDQLDKLITEQVSADGVLEVEYIKNALAYYAVARFLEDKGYNLVAMRRQGLKETEIVLMETSGIRKKNNNELWQS